MYSGVDRHVRGQSGVMIWIHKSISNKIVHYIFWNNRVIKTRLKTQRGHLTILGVHIMPRQKLGMNYMKNFMKRYRRYWIR